MVAASAALVLGLAACESATVPAPTGPLGRSLPAPTPRVPPGTAAPAPASALASRTPIEIDASLLSILPATVDGRSLDESPEVEAADAADESLVGIERLAAAFVHDDNLANWAVVTVAKVLAGTLTDGYYRSWRESFDAGACEPAGGVTGTAVAEIGGRDVTIGRCAGGVNTYHVRLAGDRIVSITAVGDKRYGELVMAALTP